MFDSITLSSGETVAVNIDDCYYNESLMAYEMLVRVVFDEDEFSFTYMLEDNEEANISESPESFEIFEYVVYSKRYRLADWANIKDCIQSLIMLQSVI